MSRTEEFGAVSRGQTFVYEPESLVLVTDPTHPLFDERVNLPLKESLVRSIKRDGVMVPIVVRSNGKGRRGKPIIEVVDGRQRVKATIEANKRLKAAGKPTLRIPAIYRRGDDGQSLTVMITTNENRQQDDVVTRAEKLKRYLDSGYDEKQAQVTFGVTARDIRQLLTVLEMGEGLKAALKSKAITMKIAQSLANLPRQEQAEMLASILSEKAKARGPVATEKASKAVESACGRMRKRSTVVAAIEALEGAKELNDYQRGTLAGLRWAMGEDVSSIAEDRAVCSG